jgi:hypothetical protein
MIKNETHNNEATYHDDNVNEIETHIENIINLFFKIVVNLDLIIKYLLLGCFFYNIIFLLSNVIKIIREG